MSVVQTFKHRSEVTVQGIKSDDDERDNQEDMDQEPLCELEKNALEEYLRSVSSKGTDRQHDQLVSEDIDVRAASC